MALLLAGAAFPGAAAAADCAITVRVDHASGTAVIDRAGALTKLAAGKTETVVSNDELCFSVTNTATGVYAISLEESPIDVVNLAAFKDLWKQGSVVTMDLLKNARAAADSAKREHVSMPVVRADIGAELKASFDALQSGLNGLQQLVGGPGGIQDTAYKASLALQQMSLQPARTAELAEALDHSIGNRFRCVSGEPPSCARQLNATWTLTDSYAAMDVAAGSLEKLLERLEEPPDHQKVEELLARWYQVRLQFDALLGAVHQTETVGLAALGSKPSWQSPDFRATWKEGKVITLRVGPRPEPDLAPYLTRKPLSFSVRLVPAHTFRLSAGVAAIYAPENRFRGYAASSGAEPHVIESGGLDGRLLWALSLAVGWSDLDFTNSAGIAVQLPEVLVSLDSATAGAGLGAGVSWSIFRLGTGLLWTKHSLLDGMAVGDALSPGQTPRTRDGYDLTAPRWYVSLSIAQ